MQQTLCFGVAICGCLLLFTRMYLRAVVRALPRGDLRMHSIDVCVNAACSDVHLTVAPHTNLFLATLKSQPKTITAGASISKI